MNVHWHGQAKCADYVSQGIDPWFDGDPKQERYAKKVCRTCPVRDACLTQALTEAIPAGVWGGHTADERRLLAQRHGYRVPSLSYTDLTQYFPIHRPKAAG